MTTHVTAASLAARCIELRHITDEEVGGKAKGLARLFKIDFTVPDGFVIVGATPDALPAELDDAYAKLRNKTVAVRSSAIGEDSEDASFAGQYDTVLNVTGIDAVRAAIVDCLRSVANERARAYSGQQRGATDPQMCVVVQEMVDAKAAGVLFTIDPVSARRDRIIIDAVPGLGEALVSGLVTPDHFVLSRSGIIKRADVQASAPVLSEAELRELASRALEAERVYGAPLDMEWAYDQGGKLYWLQARPVTNLPGDLNELDVLVDASHVHTWCNIGEMMPGAVTPLTYSVTGRGIDLGMQRMYRHVGAEVPAVDEPLYVVMQYNHLFLDLTAMADLAAHVAGADKEQMCLALCGRDVEDIAPPAPASKIRRGINGVRYAKMLLTAGNRRAILERLINSICFSDGDSAHELYRSIDLELPKVWGAFEHHLISSSASGALAPIMVRALARNQAPTEAHHAQVADWLAGATDVESADIASGAERILDALGANKEARVFVEMPPDDAHTWLTERAPETARTEYRRYLKRHGHRAVRELELRQREWAVDPEPLIVSLQSGLRGRLSGHRAPTHVDRQTPNVSGGMKLLLRAAHAAVRFREHTKSQLVATVARFKAAYRRLAVLMVQKGLLPDEDALFFLTHHELSRLLAGDTALANKATQRRAALDYQMPLRFEQVFVGSAEPIDLAPIERTDGSLVGKPVSRGVVTGIARVVRTLEEASALQSDEILIAPITDVGWTPYFNLIAGLACDVGSAVSHGAVVAREYGLPAVVDLRDATSRFKTGDLVTLDGDRGLLRLADGDRRQ